jgi:cell division septum initiation protein DivIVA
MAQGGQDLLSKLADRGEDVVGKLSEMPAAQRLLDAGLQMKDRVDELQKKVRGLDALERRVVALEKKVDELSKASKPVRKPAPKRAAAKPNAGLVKQRQQKQVRTLTSSSSPPSNN